MKILDGITDGHRCQTCGDFFPKSALVTLSGYSWSGVYCTYCAKNIIEEEMED